MIRGGELTLEVNQRHCRLQGHGHEARVSAGRRRAPTSPAVIDFQCEGARSGLVGIADNLVRHLAIPPLPKKLGPVLIALSGLQQSDDDGGFESFPVRTNGSFDCLVAADFPYLQGCGAPSCPGYARLSVCQRDSSAKLTIPSNRLPCRPPAGTHGLPRG
jgi:hypothetical protein